MVHFGKKFVSFDTSSGGPVTARFDDGSTALGDVLIGADGAASHVRGQLLPSAKRVETGIVAVSGKFALDEKARAATPPEVFRGPTLVLGPRGCFLFASAIDYGMPTEHEGQEQPKQAYDSEQYVMWGFSAHRERLTIGRNLEKPDGEQLEALVLGLMNDWHPDLRQLVSSADPTTITAFPVKTSVPMRPWRTGRVTLLGDSSTI